MEEKGYQSDFDCGMIVAASVICYTNGTGGALEATSGSGDWSLKWLKDGPSAESGTILCLQPMDCQTVGSMAWVEGRGPSPTSIHWWQWVSSTGALHRCI